ncbi:hypothetical protein GUI12_01430 [Anaplasmataceae bacterium AB001_6]|nr:hypothetical protein GUI12_01430 [Anaplasmataceae bacterium AB001_6]
MKRICINTTAGKITVDSYFHSTDRCMLLFPPHPKYGNANANPAIRTVNKAFAANNFSTLCVNLDENMGEESFGKITSNLIAWIDNNFPLLSDFWIGGMFFGSWLALNLVMRRPEITGFIALGLPNKLYDFSFLAPCSVPGILIQGEKDKYSDLQQVINVSSTIKKKMPSLFHCEVIKDGDHSFSRVSDLQKIYDITQTEVKKIIANSKTQKNENAKLNKKPSDSNNTQYLSDFTAKNINHSSSEDVSEEKMEEELFDCTG